MVTLHYLPLNAKSNVPKAILNYAKVDFKLNTYSFDELNLVKKNDPTKFEYQQLPVLEIDGFKLSQAKSISMYLSKKYNLYGDNDKESALIQSIFDSYEDFWVKFRNVVFPLNKYEEENKENFKKQFFEIEAEKYLKIYERRLVSNGKKHMVGTRFSSADIWIACVMHNLFKHPIRKIEYEPLIKKHTPVLNEFVDNIVYNELKWHYSKLNPNSFNEKYIV